MSDRDDPQGNNESPADLLSLAELTQAAGVSIRTVRYYIAEGLLPPPEGAGPRSAYRQGHLDRLRLIARLKAAYLPLKEIRRRLAGLGDDEVRRLLLTAGESPAAPGSGQVAAPAESATAYLDRVLGARPSRPASEPIAPSPMLRAALDPANRFEARATPPEAPAFHLHEPAAAMFDQTEAPASRPPALRIGAATPLWSAPAPAAGEADAWRRVALGDDAELLIRESAYQRRRDRIDWLVRWAKKVFG